MDAMGLTALGQVQEMAEHLRRQRNAQAKGAVADAAVHRSHGTTCVERAPSFIDRPDASHCARVACRCKEVERRH